MEERRGGTGKIGNVVAAGRWSCLRRQSGQAQWAAMAGLLGMADATRDSAEDDTRDVGCVSE